MKFAIYVTVATLAAIAGLSSAVLDLKNFASISFEIWDPMPATQKENSSNIPLQQFNVYTYTILDEVEELKGQGWYYAKLDVGKNTAMVKLHSPESNIFEQLNNRLSLSSVEKLDKCSMKAKTTDKTGQSVSVIKLEFNPSQKAKAMAEIVKVVKEINGAKPEERSKSSSNQKVGDTKASGGSKSGAQSKSAKSANKAVKGGNNKNQAK